MSETLPIHVNRDGLHHIDVAQSFEADDSFTIALKNHGAPIHAHLHLDDNLSEVASLSATNHYVKADDTRHVTVTVRDAPASGKLKIVTGYGAETAYVDVEIHERDEQKDSIPVDESLSKPQRTRSPEPKPSSSALMKNLPLVLLGLFALVLAFGAGLVVDGGVALFGALVVLVGLGVAAYFLLQ
ncbi:hypothetical protein SAMN05421858_1022 [Haladaptatus litoreus]|uniref:Uncharacterized protein n=1 Tax=Haladaptatus litoreus TaxID=553468 RepID=A0A1N6X7H1_9EURY|nr:hypothetical protein [Haladaptatus litoreus]SIQ98298.1 hypothetical protein SAMN05421858_1022 [Haladaptatus litoreus]